MPKTLHGVVAAVIVLMAGFIGAGMLDANPLETTDNIFKVDSDSEWQNGTLNSLNSTNSVIKLDDTATSGDYESTSQDYNDTRLRWLKVYGEQANTSDSTVTVNVTVYDDTDSVVDSVQQDVTLNETVDISSLANKSSGDYYKVSVDLSRTSTSVTSPKVDWYSVTAESADEGITTLAVVMLVLGSVAAAVSLVMS